MQVRITQIVPENKIDIPLTGYPSEPLFYLFSNLHLLPVQLVYGVMSRAGRECHVGEGGINAG